MLHSEKELFGCTVGAKDGEIGVVKDIYFDDERWAIRYLVVETGGWLSGRKVLISPISVREITWADGVVHVHLNQQQIKDSPSIDTAKPVSRQHEIDYFNYYGYPHYWEGANLWNLGMYPVPWVGTSLDSSLDPSLIPLEQRDDAVTRARQDRGEGEHEAADSHLQSGKEVVGYEIMATDGSIGNVENFVFDDQSWAIRYMGVDTRKWLPGKHVLLAPEWIEHVEWTEQEVFVKVTRQAVETSPEYDPSHPLSLEYEKHLHAHHARSVY
ncbi:MAG: PRC-barrel domain-containing protein [Sulfuriferula sp.]